jgi:hypothetical protein
MPSIGFVTVSLWCLSLKVTNLWCSGHFRAFTYFVIATKHGFTSVTISFQANQTAWKFQPTKKEEHVQSLQQEKEDVYISINSMFAMFMVIHILSLRFPEETWASKDPSGGPSCPALSELRIAMTAPQGGGVGAQTPRDPCRRLDVFFQTLARLLRWFNAFRTSDFTLRPQTG